MASNSLPPPARLRCVCARASLEHAVFVGSPRFHHIRSRLSPARLCAACASVRSVRLPCPRRGGALPSGSARLVVEPRRCSAMESQERACAPRRAGCARHGFLRVDLRLAAISRREGLPRKSFSAIGPMDTISGVRLLTRARHRVLWCVSFAALTNLPGWSCIRAAPTAAGADGRPGMRWGPTSPGRDRLTLLHVKARCIRPWAFEVDEGS